MDASGGEDKGEASDQPLLQGGQESGQGAALGNPFASAEGAVNTIQQQRQQATFAEFKPQLGSNVADEAEASFFSAHGTPASSGITAQEAVQDVGSTTKKPEANSWLPGWAKNEVKEDETKSKLAELQRKEKELAAREKALERRETEAGGAAGSLIPDKTRKNWPWCFPIVHNDIAADIPEAERPLVRFGFICWMMAESGYLLNFVTMFLMLITGSGIGFSTFLITCMATGAGVPLAWICWYKSLYHAAQSKGGVFAYLKFFFHFSAHVGYCALAFLAPPIIGEFSAGLFTMVSQFEKGGGKHGFFGFMCLMNTLLWLGCGLLSLYVLQWAFKIFRSGGGVEATQQAGSAALVAAKASMGTFGTSNT